MIKFQDLSIKKKEELNKYTNLFKKFLRSGQFILGKDVEKLENKIAKLINKNYAVGVSSGTNALYLALKAINLKKGDQVLVPCLSWLSTFTTVKVAGGEPVGIDLKSMGYTLNFKKLEKKINKKTKALIMVHFTGFLEDMNEIKKICKRKKIFLIEDCAQSFGAKHLRNYAGSFGQIACFSMNPMKVYSSFGDAGFVATNDNKIYKKLLSLRYAGTINKEYCIYPELNHKIDTFDALVLTEKLKTLKKNIQERISKAKIYSKLLNKNKNIFLPKIFSNGQHIYYSFQIFAKKRDKLFKFLNKNKIQAKIQHKYLICDHKGLKNKYNKNKNFPNGQYAKNSTLSLPIHSKIEKKNIIRISNLINKFYNEK